MSKAADDDKQKTKKLVDSYKDVDLYGLLDLEPLSSQDLVKASYKKKALIYHPDRNKTPGADKIFVKIKEAYLLLMQDEAKALYDNLIKAKLERKKREASMDIKRRTMKSALEAREKEFLELQKKNAELKKAKEQNLVALREDSARRKAQMAKAKADFLHQSRKVRDVNDTTKAVEASLKASWKTKKAFSEFDLKLLFRAYGTVTNIICQDRRAIISLLSVASSMKAMKEWNHPEISLSWASGHAPTHFDTSTSSSVSSPKTPEVLQPLRPKTSFSSKKEQNVLAMLAQAQKRKASVSPQPTKLSKLNF